MIASGGKAKDAGNQRGPMSVGNLPMFSKVQMSGLSQRLPIDDMA
jgi:hypothetical protein